MGIDAKKYPQFDMSGLPRGRRNLITDVEGVAVGQVTLTEGTARTGVTAILPHGGNLFRDKVPAACHVINGFGKSAGLVQVEELGTIEAPLVITNTLSVGTCLTGLVRYMLAGNPEIGATTGTVNGVVMECNDGSLNEIRALHVKEEHVAEAIAAAGPEFEEGAVGAGTGMCCYDMKGGVGSASRVVRLDGKDYTVGALLVTNFGSTKDFTSAAGNIGRELAKKLAGLNERDKGSVIIVLATDAPVSDRQLKRMCRRAQSGLARTGTITGNGSGDIAVGFSTARTIPHFEDKDILPPAPQLAEDAMELMFRAVIEAVQESVYSSLLHARTTTGYTGRVQRSLADLL
ncbi:MAG TPA: P1 family peptidase [Terriglobales bacterium]|nr:P1 family peptidase [Terriglobales bacterium]